MLELAGDQGRPDLVDRALSALIDIDEHGRDIWRIYIAHALESDDQAALNAVGRRAIFVDPASPLSHIAYSRALLAAGERSAALEEADVVLGMETDAPTIPAHDARRRALEALGRTAEARSEAEWIERHRAPAAPTAPAP